MINQLYVIYDRVAMESGPVFEAKNDGVALRNFQKFMEGKPYPDDFVLMHTGEIDHETNVISGDLMGREVTPTVGMVDQLEEDERE